MEDPPQIGGCEHIAGFGRGGKPDLLVPGKGKIKGMRIWPLMTLTLTLAFFAAPFLTEPFSGFRDDQLPVPQSNPPLQPAGYAFAIWGVIYLPSLFIYLLIFIIIFTHISLSSLNLFPLIFTFFSFPFISLPASSFLSFISISSFLL